MANPLKIFISHKMPADSVAAAAIAKNISEAGGPSIDVVLAEQFRFGEKFKEKILVELNATDIFIFLYTRDDADWTYCTYEFSMFENLLARDNNKQIVIMHDQAVKPPAIFESYKSLPVVSGEIFQFLKDIYIDGWKVFPKVDLKQLEKNSRGISDALERPDVRKLDLAPNFCISLPVTPENKSILKDKKIPGIALVTGALDWQKLFAKPVDTDEWRWDALTSGWVNKSLYEYEFARMIMEGIEKASPAGSLIRPSASDDLFYIRLRRYEYDINSCQGRFMFSAFEIDTPIYSTKGAANSDEVVAYNLLNICWFARRGLIDKIYPLVLNTLADPSKYRDTGFVSAMFSQVQNELISIMVQSEIRDTGNIINNKKLFPLPELVQDRSEASTFRKRIDIAAKENPPNLEEAARALYDMAQMNFNYYKKTAKKFSDLADAITLPEDPETYIELFRKNTR